MGAAAQPGRPGRWHDATSAWFASLVTNATPDQRISVHHLAGRNSVQKTKLPLPAPPRRPHLLLIVLGTDLGAEQGETGANKREFGTAGRLVRSIKDSGHCLSQMAE